jgi:quercetin dioxygenase-like cupin family protein
MKKINLHMLLIFAALLFITSNELFAQKKDPVLLTAEDIKWEPIPGGTTGAMSAKLWGDETKGAYGGLTKFPAGFKAPLHNHTNDMKIVIIKGAYIYNGKKYGTGSYLFIPGGQNHESGGAEDSETIFFSEQPGPFDLKPVAAK